MTTSNSEYIINPIAQFLKREEPKHASHDAGIAFLSGKGTDHLGRTVNDYLKFTHEEWEACHNHVQWAFPTHIPSKYNPECPVLDLVKMQQMDDDTFAKCFENLDALYNSFYKHIILYNHWMRTNDHNHLRISRILICLGLFGVVELRNNLFDLLLGLVAENPFMVTSDTLKFWHEAYIKDYYSELCTPV